MNEQTLRDYFQVIFRQKWIIILTVMSIVAVVKVGFYLDTPKYEAKVKMLVSAEKIVESPYYLQFGGSQEFSAVNTQAEIVKSNPVLKRALDIIGVRPLDYEKQFAHPLRQLIIDRRIKSRLEKFQNENISEKQQQDYSYRYWLEYLRNNIEVKPIRNTNMFIITYQDYSPSAAAAIANIISRSYVIFDLEQQLAELQIKYGEKNLVVTQLKDSISWMSQNLNDQPLSDVEAIGPASVKIIEQALVPVSKAGLSHTLVLLLAILVSFFIAITFAFLFDYLDQNFKSPDEVELFLKTPCIGSIPRKAHLSVYSNIAEKLLYKMKNNDIKVLLLTAARRKEGVTTVTAKLAQTICFKPGAKVLVIDGNMQQPKLHKFFKVSNKKGVLDILEGKIKFQDALIKVSDCLSVLTMGQKTVKKGSLLDLSRLSEVFSAAGEVFDFILIDGSNIEDTKDFMPWTDYAQSFLMVVNSIKTRKQVVRHELKFLKGLQANILGVVLNKRKFIIPSIIYNRI